MSRAKRISGLLFLTLCSSLAKGVPVLEISLKQAEKEALQTSNRLKAAQSDESASQSQASAQMASLFPRLSLEGNFSYLTTIPSLSFPGFPAVALGTNSNYVIGPVIRYTLWDNFSLLKSYQGSDRMARSRGEDLKNTKIQVLLSVRTAYIEVELALENLRMVNDSLALARAQNRDVTARFHAGAAARLDLATSERSVLNYELQFKQSQAELSSALRDLVALLNESRRNAGWDLSRPGPPTLGEITIALRLDSLKALLAQEGRANIPAPSDNQPQIQSLALQAESAEYSASSLVSRLLPVIQVSAETSLNYPNGPIPEQINQNTFAATLSFPLFLGDPTWSQASAQRSQAEAARHREDQTRIDLDRDYSKARELLRSLREQQRLASDDIQQSERVAKLYYQSYKVGHLNLIDVQNANLQALLSKVNAARIDAQILTQISTLKALSGEDVTHD